ncbi:MAG TPA: DNA polymerase III subunit delta [Candidatus Binatia bacterium]|jgi:DNA polymerase-3 subunit delta
MKANLESILAEIRKGKPPALLLLHGDDFQVRAAVQAVLDLLVPPENRAFNLERFDGRSASWNQIEASLMTPPFLSGTKTVWVESAPYFASAENKGEMGEKVLRLWGEEKKDEASRLFFQLLHLEGWTQERWDRIDAGSSAAEIAALLGDGGKEAAALLAYCRGQDFKMLQSGGGEADRLIYFLDHGLPPWGVLLLDASHVDRRTRLYKKFVEQGAALDLAVGRDKTGKLDRAALGQFLDRRLSEAGKRCEPRAREMVLARAGTELWAVHQELEKLFLYVGAETLIRAKDVEEIFLDQGEGWVFDLTGALAARDTLGALGQLARLMSQGNHPLALLGPIAGEIRRLLLARQLMDGEMGREWKSGMSYQQFQQKVLRDDMPVPGNPYALYMRFKGAENFSARELARDLGLLYETDLRLKSSGPSPRLAMERLIVDLCQK